MRQSLPQPPRSFQGRSPWLRGAPSRQLGVGIPSALSVERFGRKVKAERGEDASRSSLALIRDLQIRSFLHLRVDRNLARRFARITRAHYWADPPRQDFAQVGWLLAGHIGSGLLFISTQDVLTGAQVLFWSFHKYRLGVFNSTTWFSQHLFNNYPLGTYCGSDSVFTAHFSASSTRQSSPQPERNLGVTS